MRVLPILFNEQMVKATKAGLKTETRRLIKPQPLYFTGRHYIFDDATCPKKWEDCDDFLSTAPWQPGDILYVREAWAPWSKAEGIMPEIHYRADGENLPGVKWRPSIHMPKDAARLFLKVTDVRVERLQRIDDRGARREGCGDPNVIYYSGALRCEFVGVWNRTIRRSELPIYGWHANPFVWVISFEPCEKPEEEK